jgi:hypothetical protein
MKKALRYREQGPLEFYRLIVESTGNSWEATDMSSKTNGFFLFSNGAKSN